MFPPTKGLCILGLTTIWPVLNKLWTHVRMTSFDHNFDQFARCNTRNQRKYRRKIAPKTVKNGSKRAFTKQNKVYFLFGSIRPQVQVLSLRPYKDSHFDRMIALIFCFFEAFPAFFPVKVRNTAVWERIRDGGCLFLWVIVSSNRKSCD